MNGRISTRLLVLASLISLQLSCRRPEPQAAVPAPTPAPTAVLAPDPKVLVGRWARSDANYVIEIKNVGADGSLEASYSNPQPIHVSRAQWKVNGGKLMLAIELTDVNYPGNYYTLAHDPGSDSLAGVYNHLGVKQSYDVAFSRVRL